MLALLVEKGANGPKGILEYPTGFCYAFSEEPNIEKIAQGLGESYELTSNSLKVYPTILISHAAIQAVLELMEEHDVGDREILRIRLRIPRTAKGQGQNYHPETPLAARLSIPFCVALAAADKKISLTQFTKERLGDPHINDLMGRIEIEEDTSLNKRYPETLASVVEMEIKGNGTLRNQVIYPKGNMKNPMTEDDITDKFRKLCSVSITRERCEGILERLLHLDTSDPVQELFDSLRG
jgi:2-methylcitrate dehydratase PrpD